MSRIHSKDTVPELAVRSLVHRMGYRYGLHNANLPGKPDLVFSSRKKIIFVHGCFWHGHYCKREKMPKSRVKFWSEKITQNRRRDAQKRRALAALGWRSLIVWECEAKRPEKLAAKISNFLSS